MLGVIQLLLLFFSLQIPVLLQSSSVPILACLCLLLFYSLFPLDTLYDSVYLQILVSFTCYVRRGPLTQVPTIVLVILSCCVT